MDVGCTRFKLDDLAGEAYVSLASTPAPQHETGTQGTGAFL